MINLFVDTGSAAGGDGTTNALAGANRAFVSLADALDSLPATLTDATTITCAATGGLADTTSTNQPHWDFVTSAVNSLLVTVAAGHRHNGTYSSTKYRIEVTNGPCVYNSVPGHVTLEWLQGQVTTTTSSGAEYLNFRLATANNVGSPVAHKYKNCIATGINSGGATDKIYGFSDSDPGGSGGTSRRINCLAIGCYCAFQSDASAWGASSLGNYNCTAASDGIGWQDLQICVNCLCYNPLFGDGLGFVSTGTSGHSNNASSESSVGGTNARANQTFTFVNPGAGDFHLQSSDVGALDHGLNDPLSGFYSDDIDGQTRSGTWDIGFDEFQIATVPLMSVSMSGQRPAAFKPGGAR